MSSLLKSTLNTRALPTGDLRYIRSDFPGNLSDDEVLWLVNNNITTIVDLREEKNCYKVILQSGITRVDAHRFYENKGFDGNSKKAFDMRLSR